MSEVNISGTALITGASGFIGRRLRDELLSRNVDVVALRRTGSPAAAAGRSVTIDYADVSALARVIADEQPDYVFHVAGATKGRTYADFQRANVLPTANLLQAIEAAKVKTPRFVFVSSLASYGPSRNGRPLEETDPRAPIEFYGQSKLEAEQVVESMGTTVPWTILRPGGVYGPGDVDYFNLFKTAARGFSVYFGNRDRIFSAIYVDDCVAAMIRAACDPRSIGKGYFLSDGQPVTWGEFQEYINGMIGTRVRTVHLPEALVYVAAWGGELASRLDGRPRLFNRQKAKMGAQQAWTCSPAAAARDFSWTAAVDIKEGVGRTIEWYREHSWI